MAQDNKKVKNDGIKGFYEALKADGWKDEELGGSEDNFRASLIEPGGMDGFYDALKADGWKDEELGGSRENFKKTLAEGVEYVPAGEYKPVVDEETGDLVVTPLANQEQKYTTYDISQMTSNDRSNMEKIHKFLVAQKAAPGDFQEFMNEYATEEGYNRYKERTEAYLSNMKDSEAQNVGMAIASGIAPKDYKPTFNLVQLLEQNRLDMLTPSEQKYVMSHLKTKLPKRGWFERDKNTGRMKLVEGKYAYKVHPEDPKDDLYMDDNGRTFRSREIGQMTAEGDIMVRVRGMVGNIDKIYQEQGEEAAKAYLWNNLNLEGYDESRAKNQEELSAIATAKANTIDYAWQHYLDRTTLLQKGVQTAFDAGKETFNELQGTIAKEASAALSKEASTDLEGGAIGTFMYTGASAAEKYRPYEKAWEKALAVFEEQYAGASDATKAREKAKLIDRFNAWLTDKEVPKSAFEYIFKTAIGDNIFVEAYKRATLTPLARMYDEASKGKIGEAKLNEDGQMAWDRPDGLTQFGGEMAGFALELPIYWAVGPLAGTVGKLTGQALKGFGKALAKIGVRLAESTKIGGKMAEWFSGALERDAIVEAFIEEGVEKELAEEAATKIYAFSSSEARIAQLTQLTSMPTMFATAGAIKYPFEFYAQSLKNPKYMSESNPDGDVETYILQMEQQGQNLTESQKNAIRQEASEEQKNFVEFISGLGKTVLRESLVGIGASAKILPALFTYGKGATAKMINNIGGTGLEILGMSAASTMYGMNEYLDSIDQQRKISGMQPMTDEERNDEGLAFFWENLQNNGAFIASMRGKSAAKFVFTRTGANGRTIDFDIIDNVKDHIKEMHNQGVFEKRMSFTDYDRQQITRNAPELARILSELSQEAQAEIQGKTIRVYKNEEEAKADNIKRSKMLIAEVQKAMNNSNLSQRLLQKILYRMTNAMATPSYASQVSVEQDATDGSWRVLAKDNTGRLTEDQYYKTEEEARQQETELQTEIQFNNIYDYQNAIINQEIASNALGWLMEDVAKLQSKSQSELTDIEKMKIKALEDLTGVSLGYDTNSTVKTVDTSRSAYEEARKKKDAGEELTDEEKEVINNLGKVFSTYAVDSRCNALDKAKEDFAKTMGITPEQVDRAIKGHDQDAVNDIMLDAESVGMGIYRTAKEKEIAQKWVEFLGERSRGENIPTEEPATITEEPATSATEPAVTEEESATAATDDTNTFKIPSKDEVSAEVKQGMSGQSTPAIGRAQAAYDIARDALKEQGVNVDDHEALLKLVEDTNTSDDIKDAAQQLLNAEEALKDLESEINSLIDQEVQGVSDNLDAIECRTGSEVDGIGQSTGKIIKVKMPGNDTELYVSEADIDTDGNITGKYVKLVDETGMPYDSDRGITLASNLEILSVTDRESQMESAKDIATRRAKTALEEMRKGGPVQDGEEVKTPDGKTVKVVGPAQDEQGNILFGKKLVDIDGKQAIVTDEEIMAMRKNAYLEEMTKVNQGRQNSRAREAEEQKAAQEKIAAEQKAAIESKEAQEKAAQGKVAAERRARIERMKSIKVTDLVSIGDPIEVPSRDGSGRTTVWQVMSISPDGTTVTLKGDGNQFMSLRADELRQLVSNNLVNEQAKVGTLLEMTDAVDGKTKIWEVTQVDPYGQWVHLKSEDGHYKSMKYAEYQSEVRKMLGIEEGDLTSTEAQGKGSGTEEVGNDYEQAISEIEKEQAEAAKKAEADKQAAEAKAEAEAQRMATTGRNENGELVSWPTNESGEVDFEALNRQVGRENLSALEDLYNTLDKEAKQKGESVTSRVNNSRVRQVTSSSKLINDIYDMLEKNGGQGSARQYAINNLQAVEDKIKELQASKADLKDLDPVKMQQAQADIESQMRKLQYQYRFMGQLLDVCGTRQRSDANFSGIIDGLESMDFAKNNPQWYDYMNRLAQRLGIKIDMVSGLTNNIGSEINGVNHLGNNHIEVNYTSGWGVDNVAASVDVSINHVRKTFTDYLAGVMGHEFTHGLMNSGDKAAISEYVKAVKEHIGTTEWDKLVSSKMLDKAYKTREDAEEEVACDMAGELFTDAEFVRRLLAPKEIRAAANKVEMEPKEKSLTRLEQWKQRVDGFFKKILDFNEEYDSTSKPEDRKVTGNIKAERDSKIQRVQDSLEVLFRSAAEEVSPELKKESDLEDSSLKGVIDDPADKHSVRQGPEPTKTMEVYKLMRLGDKDENGNPTFHPLFIDRADVVPYKTWLTQDSPRLELLKTLPDGIHLVEINNPNGSHITFEEYAQEHGRYFRGRLVSKPGKEDILWAKSQGMRFMGIYPSNDKDHLRKYGVAKRFTNFGLAGEDGSVAEYALRSGWHAGSQPQMRQIGAGRPGTEGQGALRKDGTRGMLMDMRNDDEVWVKGRINLETDFTEQYGAMDMGQMESDGGYRYTTNAVLRAKELSAIKAAREQGKEIDDTKGNKWWLSTDFIIDEVLSDDAARAVIDEHNRLTGDNLEYDFTREGGRKFYADTMQVEEDRDKLSTRDTAIVSDVDRMVKEEGIDETTAEDLDYSGLTISGGVIMGKDAMKQKEASGYQTPIEAIKIYDEDPDLKFSYRTKGDWMTKYLDKKPTERQKQIAHAVDRWYERAAMDELVQDYMSYEEYPGGDLNKDGDGPLRKNVEYGRTFDLDTTCPRTFQYLNYVDQIEKKIKRFLTLNEAQQLIEEMRVCGQMIPCTYCYAENKRQALKQAFLNYINFRHNVINAQTEEEAFRAMYGHKQSDPNKPISDAAQTVLKQWRSTDEFNQYDPSIQQLYMEYNNCRNTILTTLDDLAEAGDINVQMSDKIVTKKLCEKFGISTATKGAPQKDKNIRSALSNMVNEWRYDKLENVQHKNFQKSSVNVINNNALALWDQMCKYGASSSSAHNAVRYYPYTSQLSELSPDMKTFINGMGGLRMHSTNDFRIDYVGDYFQLIADMDKGGWMGHTYTKSPEFVMIFGNTGYRINMSLAGYDVDGKVTMNEEEGHNWETAKRLKDQYKNAGCMFMTTSGAQLQFALDSDWIDMIIPFHASGLPKEVWYNMRAWEDAQSKQNEAFYSVPDIRRHLSVMEYTDDEVTGMKKALNRADLSKKQRTLIDEGNRSDIISIYAKKIDSESAIKMFDKKNKTVFLYDNTDDIKHELKEADVKIPAKITYDELASLYKNTFGHACKAKGKTERPHFLPYTSRVGKYKVPGWSTDSNGKTLTTDAERIKRYLELCHQYGVKPRFAGITVKDAEGNDIDVTEHPGYIKLIKETARMDTPQEAVKFNLDQPSEALGVNNKTGQLWTPMEWAFDQLRLFAASNGYESYKEDTYGVVDRFLENVIGYEARTGKQRPLNYVSPQGRYTWNTLKHTEKELEKMDDLDLMDNVPYHPADLDAVVYAQGLNRLALTLGVTDQTDLERQPGEDLYAYAERLSKIETEGAAEIAKQTSEESGSDIVDRITGSYTDDKFSIRGARKDEMAATLAKRRKDMSQEDIAVQIGAIESLGEETKDGGNPKLEKAATYWVANGNLTFHGKDDQSTKDNIRLALKICENKKLDPFAYKNPLELIEANQDVKLGDTLLDPKTLPELTFQKKSGDYDIYVVDDTKEGQMAVRKLIDSHFGYDANPWCIAARNPSTDDFYDSAWNYWIDTYNAVPKRVAFKNGKLVAMNAQASDYMPEVESSDAYATEEWQNIVEGCIEYLEDNENGDATVDWEATKSNIVKYYGNDVAECIGPDYWHEGIEINYPADFMRAINKGIYEDIDEEYMTWWDRTDTDHNGLLHTVDLGNGKKAEAYLNAGEESFDPNGGYEYERVYKEDKKSGLVIEYDTSDPDEIYSASMPLPGKKGRVDLTNGDVSVYDENGNRLNRWFYDDSGEIFKSEKKVITGYNQYTETEVNWDLGSFYAGKLSTDGPREVYQAIPGKPDILRYYGKFFEGIDNPLLGIKYDHNTGKLDEIRYKWSDNELRYSADTGMVRISIKRGDEVKQEYFGIEGQIISGFTGEVVSKEEAEHRLGAHRLQFLMDYINGKDTHAKDWLEMREGTNNFEYMKEGAWPADPEKWVEFAKGPKGPDGTGGKDKFSTRKYHESVSKEDADRMNSVMESFLDRRKYDSSIKVRDEIRKTYEESLKEALANNKALDKNKFKSANYVNKADEAIIAQYDNTEWVPVMHVPTEIPAVRKFLEDRGWNGTDNLAYATEAGFISHRIVHHPEDSKEGGMSDYDYTYNMQENLNSPTIVGTAINRPDSLVFIRKGSDGKWYATVINVGKSAKYLTDGRISYATSFWNKKNPYKVFNQVWISEKEDGNTEIDPRRPEATSISDAKVVKKSETTKGNGEIIVSEGKDLTFEQIKALQLLNPGMSKSQIILKFGNRDKSDKLSTRSMKLSDIKAITRDNNPLWSEEAVNREAKKTYEMLHRKMYDSSDIYDLYNDALNGKMVLDKDNYGHVFMQADVAASQLFDNASHKFNRFKLDEYGRASEADLKAQAEAKKKYIELLEATYKTFRSACKDEESSEAVERRLEDIAYAKDYYERMGKGEHVYRNMDDPRYSTRAEIEKSDNFKKWFGDWEKDPEKASKVVDEEGRPKVVHHGTDAYGFTVFDTSTSRNKDNVGSHFGSKEVAGEFGGESKMYNVYLDIKKPWETFDWFADSMNNAYLDAATELMKEIGTPAAKRMFDDRVERIYPDVPKNLLRRAKKEGWSEVFDDDEGLENTNAQDASFMEHRENLVELIKSLMEIGGYDGIKYDNWYEGNKDTECWIALYPEQIKSADTEGAMANTGGFDPRNPDIRYSTRSQVPDADEAARGQVINEIRSMMDDGLMKATRRSDLNRMLSMVKNANAGNLLQMISNAQRVIRTVKTEMLGHELDELLKLKVQDRNGKGMSVAKNVDNETRQLVEDIRGRFYGVMESDESRAISNLYRENIQMRKDINALDVQISRGIEYLDGEDQPLTDQRKQEMQDEISQLQAKISENNTKIKDLRDKRKATIRTKITDSSDELQKKIDDKMEYMDKCVDPAYPDDAWTQADTRELTELEILKARMDIEKTDDEIETRKQERSQATRKAHWEALDTLVSDLERQRLDQVQALVDKVRDVIQGGKESLASRQHAEMAHKSELITGMMGDIRGLRGKKMPADPEKAAKRGKGSDLVALLTGPLKSFEYMAHTIDQNHFSRDGWFYKYFVEGDNGVMAANNSYLKHYSESMKTLRDKTQEIFGKEAKKVSEDGTKRVTDHGITIVSPEETTTGISLTGDRMPLSGIWGLGEDGEAIPLSKNNATYLWMVWQMADGRAKMQNMGFDEQSMAEIKEFIGDEMVEWAKYVQDEYLPSLFPRYQEKYIEIYGTPMANIDHYVPLKIDGTQIKQDSNMQGDQIVKNAMSQKNGFQINRTVNLKPVSLIADCFDVIQTHIQEAEEFNAYATVRKDLDTLFSSNAVVNQLNANEAGSARDLQKSAQIAVRSDIREDVGAIERGLIKATKGIVGGNIAFRIGTAFKQTLSAPVFAAYTHDPAFTLKYIVPSLVKNFTLNQPGLWGGIFNKDGLIKRIDKDVYAGFSDDFVWAVKNIPSFKDRVSRGTMGMDIFDTDTGNAGKVEAFFQKYLNKGMAANQLIDAITCVSGINAIYKYEMAKNKARVDSGEWTQQQAENFAKMQADIFYNGTQQSSHAAFLSPVQTSKHALPKAFMAYQNASVGFARKALENAENLLKAAERRTMIESYKATYQMLGKTEAEAQREAEKIYGQKLRKSLVQLGMFGLLANFLWDLGGKGLYGLYMNDEQKEDLFEITSLPSYVFRGTPGFNVASSLMAGEVKSPLLFYEELRGDAEQIKKLTDKYGVMSPQLMQYTLTKALRIPGVDLEVMANMYLGLEDLATRGTEADLMLDAEFLINLAKGNRQSTAKQIYKDEPLDEQAKIVLRAGKVFEDNDWRKWLPGSKTLTKEKYDQVMNELAKARLTDEEIKDAPMTEKEMQDVVKHLNNDDDLRQAYNATTDETLRNKIIERAKDISKTKEFDAQTWEQRADAYAKKQEAKVNKKSKSPLEKGRKIYEASTDYDSQKRRDAVSNEIKRIETEYIEPWKALSNNPKRQMELEKTHQKDAERYSRLKELEANIKEIESNIGTGSVSIEDAVAHIEAIYTKMYEIIKK